MPVFFVFIIIFCYLRILLSAIAIVETTDSVVTDCVMFIYVIVELIVIDSTAWKYRPRLLGLLLG